MRRVAVIDDFDATIRANLWQIFRQRLRDLGYAEGRNLAIESRWADGVTERIPQLIEELIAGRPEVFVATTTPTVRALMRASPATPVVMTGQADPVATGLIASLASPGGNVTGVSGVLTDQAVKRMEILREILPSAKRFALLGPAGNPGVAAVFQRLQSAAPAMGVTVRLLDVDDIQAIRRAFDGLAKQPVDGILVAAVMRQHTREIVDLAARRRIATAHPDRQFAEHGGLLAFGPDSNLIYRRVAEYVHRILEGAKPADLPVEQVSRFELVVNLRTAKALGIKLPQAVLVRVDRVIE